MVGNREDDRNQTREKCVARTHVRALSFDAEELPLLSERAVPAAEFVIGVSAAICFVICDIGSATLALFPANTTDGRRSILLNISQ